MSTSIPEHLVPKRNSGARGMKAIILTLLVTAHWQVAPAQGLDENWQAKAIEKYTELGTRGSEFNTRFVTAYKLRRLKSPDFFTNPQWPVILADEVAGVAALAAAEQSRSQIEESRMAEATRQLEAKVFERPTIKRSDAESTKPAVAAQKFNLANVFVIVVMVMVSVFIIFAGLAVHSAHTTKIPYTGGVSVLQLFKLIFKIFFGGSG